MWCSMTTIFLRRRESGLGRLAWCVAPLLEISALPLLRTYQDTVHDLPLGSVDFVNTTKPGCGRFRFHVLRRVFTTNIIDPGVHKDSFPWAKHDADSMSRPPLILSRGARRLLSYACSDYNDCVRSSYRCVPSDLERISSAMRTCGRQDEPYPG